MLFFSISPLTIRMYRTWFLTCLCALGAYGMFDYKDCTPSDSPLTLTKLDVLPNPILLPGDISVTLEGSSNASIGSSSLTLSMARQSFLGDIHIPCIQNVGSCTYDDICTVLDQMERENWGGVMGNLATQIKRMLVDSGVNPTQCPFPPQSLRIENFSIHLPEVSAALSSFAAGDYSFHISLVEKSSGKEILCVDAVAHLKQQCSGLSCIFG